MRKCDFSKLLNRMVSEEAETRVTLRDLASTSNPRRKQIKTLLKNARLQRYRTPEGHEVRRVKYTRTAWDARKLRRLLTTEQLRQCRKLEHGERLEVTAAAGRQTKRRKAA